MRVVHWLFLISVAMFISGIAFVVAAGRPPERTAPVETLQLTPVASVAQIMNGIVAPAAKAVFDAVGTVVDASGIHETIPKDDREWAAVGNSAAALIEAANLLLIGDRAIDHGDWVKMSRAMADAGHAALEAADAKSADGILAAGAIVNESCDNCHQTYQRN